MSQCTTATNITAIVTNIGLIKPSLVKSLHYHCDKGPLGLIFNDTIKLPDLKNPLLYFLKLQSLAYIFVTVQ